MNVFTWTGSEQLSLPGDWRAPAIGLQEQLSAQAQFCRDFLQTRKVPATVSLSFAA
jgi:hypothetical protein